MPEALVEVAFVVVGDLADYGFSTNGTDGIRRRLSQETGIPQGMISITAESASVRITATLRVPTNQEADTVLQVLRTIFATPESASNVMNLNITHTEFPLISRSVPSPPSANEQVPSTVWITSISGGCALILFCLCILRYRMSSSPPTTTPSQVSWQLGPERTFLTTTELYARQMRRQTKG